MVESNPENKDPAKMVDYQEVQNYNCILLTGDEKNLTLFKMRASVALKKTGR